MSTNVDRQSSQSGDGLKIRVYSVRLRAWAPGKKPRQLWLLRRLKTTKAIAHQLAAGRITLAEAQDLAVSQ